jgi:hypothetical protein
MPAEPNESARLKALHEAYIWRVNAAVQAGRDSVVQDLMDEYLDEGLASLTAGPAEDFVRLDVTYSDDWDHPPTLSAGARGSRRHGSHGLRKAHRFRTLYRLLVGGRPGST